VPDTILRPSTGGALVQDQLIPGSDAYWRDRKDAFALVVRLHEAIRQRRRAPLYLAGPGYDSEDCPDDVIENLGPWNCVADLRQQAKSNPTVMEILVAQRRLLLLED
jgi:hypothetical protein